MKDFKYKTFFNTTIPVVMATEKSDIALASLKELRALLPEEEEIEENEDLLYTAFNSCVVNLINANDDGVMTKEGLQMAPKFTHRQLNIEHNRSMVIGHITGYGFSSFVDNQLLSAEDLKDTSDPFNIALSGIIYKVVDPYFADFLKESSDEKGLFYQSISASWEVGFDEYVVCVGSKKIKDAEIVSEDAQVKELSKYLKCMGGTGFMKDGTPVYRVVVGNPVPLGCGFTANPAAAVQGVLVAKEDAADTTKQASSECVEPNITLEEMCPLVVNEYIEYIEQATGRGEAVIVNALKSISARIQKDDVIEHLESNGIVVKDSDGNLLSAQEILKNVSLEFNNFSDLQKLTTLELLAGVYQVNILRVLLGYFSKDKLEIEEVDEKNEEICENLAIFNEFNSESNSQLVANRVTTINPIKKIMKITRIEDIQQDKWEEISASTVRDFIVEKIDEVNQKYVELQKQAEDEKASLLAEKTALDENVSSALNKIKDLETELSALKQEKLDMIANQKFQDRMSALDEEFNLEDAQRKIVAKQIQGLSDEDFLAWKEDFSVFASQKTESQETREEKATEALASVETKVEEVIPNAAQLGEGLLVDQFRESFALGKGLSITKRK